MSLSSALNSVQSIFNNTGIQSSVVSTNISNSGNSDYVRRQAAVTTSLNGAQVVKIDRAQEDALLKQYLKSNSQDTAQQGLLSGLEDLKSLMGGNDYETSPANYLSAFRDALQTFSASPSSTTAAQAAVTAAKDVANSLNNASASVQKIRADADDQIATDVTTLNGLLAQFQTANDAVKQATATGTDSSAALDERDKVLKQISSIIGINAVTRDNNDMALYTSDGTTLFETTARSVTFQSTDTYVAGMSGNNVYIDGVVVKAGDGSTTTAQGSIQAQLQVRGEIAETFQSQLDEIAKSLVSMFSETDGATTVPGLFVWKTSAGAVGGTPTTGDVIDGISATISVNINVQTGVINPLTGVSGDPMKLRDGSISGLTNLNPDASSGFSSNLDALYSALGTAQSFSSDAGISSNVNLMDYASNSIGWLEQYRSDATTASENTSAALSRSDEAYSNETGVNLDEELTLLLDIEQSYKAATKILNAIDEMLKSLLDIASKAMKSSFISSSAIQNAMRLTIRQSQQQLVTSSLEATTGVYADIGVSLGSGAAKSVNFSNEISRITALKSSNSVVNMRLESSQLGLTSMKDAGDALVSKLTALQGSQDSTSITVAIQSANDALSSLMDTANTMVNGEYLFAGVNTDVQPLANKSASVSGDITTALTSYAAGLGKPVEELTGTEMDDFITNTVEPMFDEANWTDPATGWSSASSQNMTSRISSSEVITSSTNANSEGMRYFALASVMTSALFSMNLGADALGTVTSKAIGYAAQATSGIVTQASQLGLSQERVEKANDALDAQSNIIQNKLVDLQGVDTSEASTLVNTLQTQLETAYTIVSKIQQLSLVNYL